MLPLILITLFVAVYLFVYVAIMPETMYYMADLRKHSTKRTGIQLLIMPVIDYLIALNEHFMAPDSPYLTKLRKKLLRAGFGEYSAKQMLALQEFYAIIAVTCVTLLMTFAPIPHKNPLVFLALIVVSAGIGFLLPVMPLGNIIAKRQLEILRDWPYLMDLLILSMESGLNMTLSIERIVGASPMSALMNELVLFLNETRLGARRSDAMREMADRINIPEISGMINMLVQAEDLGTEVGPLLNVQAKEFRDRRAAKVEKLAMEAPVKMMGPLLGLIFPCILLIIVGPIMIQYYKTKQ